MSQPKIKIQNWEEFDKIFEAPESLKSFEPKDVKKIFAKPNDVTDGQRKMIIAIFTNELGWDHEHSFNFVLKVIPGMKKRLSPETIDQKKLEFMYNKLTKKEASKLINIIKAISRRKK